ncbi:TIGR02186 family protein [Limoniibacter endophyticus]|uniref:TIGR02186 family protein n=1 Tax=Limoniibacter endophyticus TaxID=1565040 RepID=A0A8J3DFJ9_9HYPH|nr:TIGR02186 family protein [Limoniibacter endophyticus]GHC66519.1 hypothetical protein GCM10010136_09680 [Limoniibacter endophyticus]
MRWIAAWIVTLLTLVTAAAQEDAAEPSRPPENIQIGLSTDHVLITSDFSGANLTIFGALENLDPTIATRGRYDVIVVLEGPTRAVRVREKERVVGMWINTRSQDYLGVPISYSLASTRPLQDITGGDRYRQLSLGSQYIYLRPDEEGASVANLALFTQALRDAKRANGSYTEIAGGVEFLSRTLFRATLRLAPNVPVGTHRARAFLFRNGEFMKESSAILSIRKAGFEQQVFTISREYGMFYGIFAVLLAVFIGWIGSMVFQRKT